MNNAAVGSDPLQSSTAPGSTWTTTNLAEAYPGVLTPLGWTSLSGAMERSMRRIFHSVGVLTRRDLPVPAREEERIFGVFFGRFAVRVDFLCVVGDRLPGTSGAAVAEQLFSYALPGYVSRPARRYYPLVGVRFPMACVRAPRLVREARAVTAPWWRSEVAAMATADVASSRRSYADAIARLEENLFRHGLAHFSLVQPLYDQLARLVAATGVATPGLMSGSGTHAETQMVADLWACSRGRLDLDTFLDSHGYHGPREGEISSVMWREDPSPLHEILEGYRSLGDGADPLLAESTRTQERSLAERELLAALPVARRAWARSVLALAGRYVPLRGQAKVAFVQSIDVARAAARRLGECLVAEGTLAEPDDIFFLTSDELCSARWEDAEKRIAFRRERHEAYQRLELPVTWQGTPVPQPVEVHDGVEGFLQGVGVSPGVAEGVVRVLTDPGEVAMEPGEILVAHTTDPSWASVLFLSSALVTDIGGQLSHAAVVARELQVPCVVNTKVGTKVLRTGDRCRVDGTTGRIEVLERARVDRTPAS